MQYVSRMLHCNGLELMKCSLAMAEMTTLVAAIYRKYQTSIGEGFEDTTPAITARVEIFCEERFRAVRVSSLLFIIFLNADPS